MLKYQVPGKWFLLRYQSQVSFGLISVWEHSMVDDASHIGGLLYIWSVTDVYYGGKLLAHQELTHGGLLQYLCSDKLLSQELTLLCVHSNLPANLQLPNSEGSYCYRTKEKQTDVTAVITVITCARTWSAVRGNVWFQKMKAVSSLLFSPLSHRPATPV